MFELDLYGNAMTPTYLRALQAAILASPACAEHVIDNSAGKVPANEARAKDQAIADILRTEGFGAGSRAVPAWHAKRMLIMRGKWRGIVQAAADPAHPAVDAAYAAVALGDDARMDIDFCDPTAKPMLDALIAAGLLTPDDAQTLHNMSLTDSTVTAVDVSRALRGPWGDE